ncbi:MAG: adenylate/guanylate cyclase domain-containing protein [Alphaproteobacteria bacterium]|jgi:class 3 adenylate cyclase|nr:adenylate/guanylate cyclase domain-containing protein [Alphaproteobacteria bacterium]
MRRVFSIDFHFDHSPEALWPLIIDTARLNEATGFPRHSVTQTARPDGSVERIARGKFGPFQSEWEDFPWEWEEKHKLRHIRRFRKGIFKTITALLELTPEGDGTRWYGELGIESGNMIGTLFLLLGGGDIMIRNYRKFLAADIPYRLDNGPMPIELVGDKVSAAVRSRLTQLVSEIDGGPYGHNLARPLAEFIATGADVDMNCIRPLVLARKWDTEPRKIIELCLEAVRVGLLGMRWDLICPRCRGGEGAIPDLESLPEGIHCPSCNIDYQRNFSANVELSFHPAPAIREINPEVNFCLMSPSHTPHVLLQKILQPGESAELEIDIAPGAYDLRTLEPGAMVEIDYEGGGFPEVIAGDSDMQAGEKAAAGKALLRNDSKKRLTLLIERRDWLDNILTADKVSTLQAFRDLCGNQVLRAGDDAAIEHITLMFSDLRGSTALYNRIGDGPAYHLVREHFAFLAGEVREHNGAIIKTIGDAVMAAFGEPADAVGAMLSIQSHIAAFNAAQQEEKLVIKLGAHAGRTIAVNLNGRLDYFGATVNLAARLQQESAGGDIVLSDTLAHDPAVRAVIDNQPTETGTAAMKGFDEPIAYTRLRSPA